MSTLDVLRSVLPPDYINRLLASEYDAALLRGMASMFDKVSDAVRRLEESLSILDAPEGSNATTTLELTPTTSLGAAVVVKAGSMFADEAGTRIFYMPLDAVVGPGFASASVSVLSLGQSSQYNCKGEYTSLGGEVVPGTIVHPKRLVLEPPYGCDVVVRQTADATGGNEPALSTQGEERGVFRGYGESVEAYRDRVHSVPDTVSPDAFERNCHKALVPYTIQYRVTEGWREAWTFFDTEGDEGYNSFDDDGTEGGVCSERDLTSTIAVTHTTKPLGDMGAPLDDVPVDPLHDNVFSGGGFVASPCLDGDDAETMIAVVLDGEDTPMIGVYAALFVTLDKTKAGGTAVFVEGG